MESWVYELLIPVGDCLVLAWGASYFAVRLLRRTGTATDVEAAASEVDRLALRSSSVTEPGGRRGADELGMLRGSQARRRARRYAQRLM